MTYVAIYIVIALVLAYVVARITDEPFYGVAMIYWPVGLPIILVMLVAHAAVNRRFR